LIRATHRAADLTIAVSQKTAADLVAAGACDARHVRVWPKAVDCQRFSPAHACPDMRRRLEGRGSSGSGPTGTGSPAAGPLLLYVGRVSFEKNLELLRRVLQRVPGARLAVVGSGPALPSMRRHFEGTATTFLGELRGLALSAAYASADVFVMPSESETLGNVVGEVSWRGWARARSCGAWAASTACCSSAGVGRREHISSRPSLVA
jgi:sulfoquinovosyltransferase